MLEPLLVDPIDRLLAPSEIERAHLHPAEILHAAVGLRDLGDGVLRDLGRFVDAGGVGQQWPYLGRRSKFQVQVTDFSPTFTLQNRRASPRGILDTQPAGGQMTPGLYQASCVRMYSGKVSKLRLSSLRNFNSILAAYNSSERWMPPAIN